MKHENVKKIEFSQYDEENIKNLKKTKNMILARIRKYIPEGDGDARIWDMQEEIEKDIQFISAYLFYISPLIGYLEGMADYAEEHKKLAMAEIRNEITKEINSGAPKMTKEDKDARSRENAKEEIKLMIEIKSMGMEYKRFHFQANEWMRNAQQRVKSLDKEKSMLRDT